jgi:hypothetical protein
MVMSQDTHLCCRNSVHRCWRFGRYKEVFGTGETLYIYVWMLAMYYRKLALEGSVAMLIDYEGISEALVAHDFIP